MPGKESAAETRRGVFSKKISREKFLELLGGGGVALFGGAFLRTLLESEPSPLLNSPEQSIIDGVITYGHERPLTREEYQQLKEEIASKVVSGEIEMAPNRYYMTLLIASDQYGPLPVNPGETETPQSFFKRHAQFFTNLEQEVDPSLGGLVLRRVIVYGPEITPPASWHFGYLRDNIADSDGVWRIDSSYDPTQMGYYQEDIEIDLGLCHETGHTVKHWPDHYSLDYHPPGTTDEQLSRLYGEDRLSQVRRALVETSTPFPLEDIPWGWRRYITSLRNDPGNTLMNVCAPRLGPHEILQLKRRVREGWTHDFKRTIPEGAWAFPNEVPQNSILELGSQFNGATVKIYRTEGSDNNKTLAERPVFEGQVVNGQINIGNPFAGFTNLGGDIREGLIPSFEGSLFMRVETARELFWRWMDVRDFNLAFWRGFPEVAHMRMDLASINTSPENFDWTILYNPSHIFLPLIEKSS